MSTTKFGGAQNSSGRNAPNIAPCVCGPWLNCHQKQKSLLLGASCLCRGQNILKTW